MLTNAPEKKVSPWMNIFDIVYKYLSHYLLSLVCVDIRTAGIHCISDSCFKWSHHRKKHQHQRQKGMLGKLVSPTKCFKKPLSVAAWTLNKHLYSPKVSYFQMQIIWCIMQGKKALLPENKIRQQTDFTKGGKKVEALTNGLCLIFLMLKAFCT